MSSHEKIDALTTGEIHLDAIGPDDVEKYFSKSDPQSSRQSMLRMIDELEKSKKELETTRNAYANIAGDIEKKNLELEMTQKALLNILQDVERAKNETEKLNVTLEQRVEEATRELRESSIQLIQSEKLSALGELTAGVAHELNQPLNVIKIIAQSISREIGKPDSVLDQAELKDDLSDVIAQINKMAAIINHMRVFTRTTVGDTLLPVSLNSVITNALIFHEQQLRNRNIVLTRELQDNLPFVHGDEIRLEQVVINLLTNARDALEKKSVKKITIKTYSTDDKKVVIECRDNGAGIPEHIKNKIFNPFYTTKEPGKGTGLGLSVSKKIIEEHKGIIEAESELGMGAVFRIRLPVSERDPSA
jgi:C4-dicarboxylate-specific signal transduction histidine kinase